MPSRQDHGAPSTVSTRLSGTSLHAGGDCRSQKESEEAGMRRGTAPSSPVLEGTGSVDAGAEFGVTEFLVCSPAECLWGSPRRQEVS